MKTTVQTITPTHDINDLLHESSGALEHIERCGDAGLSWVSDLDSLTLQLGLPSLDDMEPRLHELLAEAPTELARGIAIGLSLAWLSSFALPLPLSPIH